MCMCARAYSILLSHTDGTLLIESLRVLDNDATAIPRYNNIHNDTHAFVHGINYNNN